MGDHDSSLRTIQGSGESSLIERTRPCGRALIFDPSKWLSEGTTLAGRWDHPGVLVFRFETFEGRPSSHYATTRVMKADCIGCHNQDPNSTRRDRRVGDVAGVLELIRPLDRDIARTRDGLHGRFLLTAMVSGALLVLSALVLVVRSQRPV